MYFMYTFYTVVYYSILSFHFVNAVPPVTTNAESTTLEEEVTSATTETPTEETDIYTFIALLEILFTNGTKKSCTGTIIHEKVVITAGHCFIIENVPWLLPELTASFVVIGSRLMFEAGYEQYLPIEKVITHPQFKGWSADLALVYTFAVMTSDKPGQVIPLAGNRSLTPVDSNVTVLSWGYCKGSEDANVRTSEHGGSDTDTDSTENGEMKEIRTRKPTKGIDFEESTVVTHKHKHILNRQRKHNSRKGIRSRKQHQAPIENEASDSQKLSESNMQYISKQKQHRKPKENKKRYQQVLRIETPDKDNPMINKDPKPTKRRGSKYLPTNKFGLDIQNEHKYARKVSRTATKRPIPDLGLAAYRNWRRVMGSQGQNLSVEVFNFVNVQTCKKLIEKVKPSTYSLNNKNEVLCYSSDDYFITNEDAGAPAIQQNNLVAVTIGGVEADGDHVAIGMKMSCFCLWIAQNLPDGDGDDIACCMDCCETEHFEKTTTIKMRHLRKPVGRQGRNKRNKPKTYDYYGIQRFSGGEGNEEAAGPDPKSSESKEDSSGYNERQ